MTKYIAHASIDERGKTSGGKAGDKTKKEVCIRNWYDKTWNYVLRIKNQKVRYQFANSMIDIANNECVGYDQSQRNTLLTQAIKVNFDFAKIKEKCECDCSSMITVAILGAIYKVLGKAQYDRAYKVLYANKNCKNTSTLRSGLTQLGMIDAYKDKSYTRSTSKSAYGDIFIKEGSHVVCFIDDKKKRSVKTSTTNYYKRYTGKSLKIDQVFKSIGAPYGNVTKRKPVALKNSCSNYKGSAVHNLKLIALAKLGKLKKV